MNITTAQHQGSRREQQDAFAVAEVDDRLCEAAVFDGLGGHPNGRQAAQAAAAAWPDLEQMNAAVCASGGLTTFSEVRLHANGLFAGSWCGDSPIYYFKDGKWCSAGVPEGSVLVADCLPLGAGEYTSLPSVTVQDVTACLVCSDGVCFKDLETLDEYNTLQDWVNALGERKHSDNVTAVRISR